MAKTQITGSDIADVSISDTDVAAANKDGVKSLASMRTLSASTPAAVAVDSGAAAGAGQTASSSDHAHQIATYASAPAAADATAASAGTSGVAPARGDHRHLGHAQAHDHSAAGDGTTLNVVTLYAGDCIMNHDQNVTVGNRIFGGKLTTTGHTADYGFLFTEHSVLGGVLAFGDGIAGHCDANLYRGAANQLKTDDSLEVAGALTVSGVAVVITSDARLHSQSHDHSAAGDGTALAPVSIAIGGGSPITKHLSGTATWDPGSIANGAQTTTSVTVTGAAVGDTVAVGFSVTQLTMILSGYVSAPNTVTVIMLNFSGAARDLASGTLRADVWKH